MQSLPAVSYTDAFARPYHGGVIRKTFRVMRPFVPIVFAFGLLGLLSLRVRPSEVIDQLGHANLYWIPALLVANLASDFFRAWRWRQQLPQDKRPPIMLLFFAGHIGSAVNFIVPLRAGEAIRTSIVSQRTGIEPANLVAVIFGDILTDMLTFSVYISIGFILLPGAVFLWPVGLVAGIVTVTALVGGYRLARNGEKWGGPPTTSGLRGWTGRALYHFAQGLASLRDTRRYLLIVLTAQGVWFFETLMFYMSGRALGIDLPYPAYMLIIVTANVAGSVPITQAGFGVFELGVGGVMHALGPSVPESAAYALFVHVLLTAPHLAYGPFAAIILPVRPSEILLVGKKSEDAANGDTPEPAPFSTTSASATAPKLKD